MRARRMLSMAVPGPRIPGTGADPLRLGSYRRSVTNARRMRAVCHASVPKDANRPRARIDGVDSLTSIRRCRMKLVTR